jgi:CTP:molybdopterin cytidylyltransferase MocA
MSRSVSGVLLAAGTSRRFGGRPKQLATFDGEPLVRRAARQALESRLAELVVVVGFEADRVRSVLEDLQLPVVENAAYGAGQSTSVAAGLEAVDEDADACLFLPCDQPYLAAKTLNRLLWAYERTGGGIVVPAFRGRRGAPTLFDRRYFPELRALTGDAGGRQLLQRHPESILSVDLESELPLLDADTPEELERLHREPPEKRFEGQIPGGWRRRGEDTIVDHLVYGVPDLAAGIEEWARLTGVEPAAGGSHPAWGTANALLSLGPHTYLEILGPDPAADPSEGPRPRLFGLDGISHGALCGWAAAVPDLEDRVQRCRAEGYDPGPVATMSRRRPDGSELRWQLAVPRDLQLREGGCVPFLIDWQGAPSPAASAPAGCRLVQLSARHPEPERVRGPLEAMGLELAVERGGRRGPRAVLETPAGLLLLDPDGARSEETL